jgi:hypothetical protein
MTPIFDYINVSDIDLEDKRFIVTYQPDMQVLEHAVARMGVLTPIHLRRPTTHGRLQLICGFKRLVACLNTAQPRVPALVHSAAALSDEQAFLLALYDNLGCRTFNAVEKGRLLQRLRDNYHYDLETLTQHICPLLQLPPRPNSVALYATLVTLDEALQKAIVLQNLPLDTAVWIGRQAASDRQVLLELFITMRLGRNRAQEFASLIEDICRRDSCRVSACFQSLGVDDILADPQPSRPQKVERVRQALRRSRYPQLSAYEQQFHATVRELRLPSQIHLQPPPYFEGQHYRVSFTFNSRQELLQVAQSLAHAAANNAVDDLLLLL